MRVIIKHPARELMDIHGILAHVEEAERKRILALPYNQFWPEIKRLTKEVDLAKFPRRKKSIAQDYSNHTKFKPQPYKEPDHDDDL